MNVRSFCEFNNQSRLFWEIEETIVTKSKKGNDMVVVVFKLEQPKTIEERDIRVKHYVLTKYLPYFLKDMNARNIGDLKGSFAYLILSPWFDKGISVNTVLSVQPDLWHIRGGE